VSAVPRIVLDASVGVIMSVNNSLVCYGINKDGTQEQKEKYLKDLASGKTLGAFALSEPEAGSDASNQRTTAVRDGESYVLNGSKNWITNGSTADIVLVMAATDRSKGAKGISTFIVEKGSPGFAVAKKEIPCRLVLIGDGGLKAALFDLAKKLCIEEDVLFLGFQDNPFKYVAHSSLFVFSSLYEGFGNAILEAMAVGCPVVSYDCVAGPREILAPDTDPVQHTHSQEEGKYGVLIPVGDISGLSKIIVTLLGNSQLRKKYSELGLKRVLEFGIDGMIQKYLDVIVRD